MLQGEHSAICSTFIKLPFFIKIFVLSILEWPFYTGMPANNEIHQRVLIIQQCKTSIDEKFKCVSLKGLDNFKLLEHNFNP